MVVEEEKQKAAVARPLLFGGRRLRRKQAGRGCGKQRRERRATQMRQAAAIKRSSAQALKLSGPQSWKPTRPETSRLEDGSQEPGEKARLHGEADGEAVGLEAAARSFARSPPGARPGHHVTCTRARDGDGQPAVPRRRRRRRRADGQSSASHPGRCRRLLARLVAEAAPAA